MKKEWLMGDGKVKVLLVDDSETFCSVMRMAFATDNEFDLVSVGSGHAALELLKESIFDVLILDHHMPGMSGLNVLQRVHEEKMDIPVVMLTAEGAQELAVEAMKLGAYDYLKKDQIDIDHLPITIRAVHELHKLRLEREEREREKQERIGKQAGLESLRNTLGSLTDFVHRGVSMISLTLRELEQNFAETSVTAKPEVMTSFDRLRDEFGVLKSGVQSILSLSYAYAKESEHLAGFEIESSIQLPSLKPVEVGERSIKGAENG